MALLDDLLTTKTNIGTELAALAQGLSTVSIDGLSFTVRTRKELIEELESVCQAIAREEGPTEQHSVWINA